MEMRMSEGWKKGTEGMRAKYGWPRGQESLMEEQTEGGGEVCENK